jgi:exoribonuclease R
MMSSEVFSPENNVPGPVPGLRIITADDPHPRERDDGIGVETFATKPDTFRVTVCVADPSNSYYRDDVYKQALDKTTATYGLDTCGNALYDPMISPAVIKRYEFTQGRVPSALMVSFSVGPDKAPSETEISFGPVEVMRNLTFSSFAKACEEGKVAKKYGEAGRLIKKHLAYNPGIEYQRDTALAAMVDEQGKPLAGPSGEAVRMRGSRINEAYMIAANHLVPALMAELDIPFIYRVCNPEDNRFRDIVSPGRALYSMTPGRHQLLGLDVYTHVTSPLRRGVDLVLGHVLKNFSLGKPVTARDIRDMELMTQRSNMVILEEVRRQKFRLPKPVLAQAATASSAEVA